VNPRIRRGFAASIPVALVALITGGGVWWHSRIAYAQSATLQQRQLSSLNPFCNDVSCTPTSTTSGTYYGMMLMGLEGGGGPIVPLLANGSGELVVALSGGTGTTNVDGTFFGPTLGGAQPDPGADVVALTTEVTAAPPSWTGGGVLGFGSVDLTGHQRVTPTYSGRAYQTFTFVQQAGVTSEALASTTSNANGTTTGAVTTFTIPTGKTLRITAITLACRLGAGAAGQCLLNLRNNTTGATTASSPLVYSIEADEAASVSGTGETVHVDIPDGLEFTAGGSNSIGFSHVDSATTNVVTFTASGFLYTNPG
jgi:hypothetical protein